MESQKGGFFGKIFKLLIVVVVVAAGIAAYRFLGDRFLAIGETDYQAVFLTNGQVYFGKVKNLNAQYALLEDVYYVILQRPASQPVAPEGGEVAPETAPTPAPSYTLRKLGGEIHAPADRMLINRDHILMVEDLQSEGKLIQAIEQSKRQVEQSTQE
ncbi:hypothetical protein L6258_00915 [Candidatus Parcubacteria bacterium]|nr:hypothetical protein [Candidatus Parcubacteria bacterium]